MTYNSTGYNTLAHNVFRVFESGSITSKVNPTINTRGGYQSGYNTVTHNKKDGGGFANEFGEISGDGILSISESGLADESGIITTTVNITLNVRGGYQQAYNSINYNKSNSSTLGTESGEIKVKSTFDASELGVGFASGTVISTSTLSVNELRAAIDSGTITITATNNAIETASATESGTVAVDATLAAVERAGAVYQRIFSRSVDLSFTKSLIVEFDEDKRMTEIQAIDDTLSDETRVLEFTAEDNGTAKDISGGKISWSLAEGGNVILSDSDPEVSTSIVDGVNGRFDVTIDGFDVDPGGYRQRVEVVDTQGKVTRSNGPYRIREF